MRSRWAVRLLIAAFIVGMVGCDSGGGGASPKAEGKPGVELKPLPPPGAPGGAAPKKAPGGAAKAD